MRYRIPPEGFEIEGSAAPVIEIPDFTEPEVNETSNRTSQRRFSRGRILLAILLCMMSWVASVSLGVEPFLAPIFLILAIIEIVLAVVSLWHLSNAKLTEGIRLGWILLALLIPIMGPVSLMIVKPGLKKELHDL